MHELSIATSVVELASRHAAEHGGGRVTAIRLLIGRLSCVHEAALRFGFDLARVGTPLAEARLEIVAVPVRIWCPTCGVEQELPGIQRFACPACGTPSADIRAGQELELESLLVESPAP